MTELSTTVVSDNYLTDGLNPPQKEAVLYTQGPLLILAGAGTGKTRVLTTRIAHLINTAQAFPSEILAVTFTNKAAQEMRERVARLLDRDVEGLWLGTFHALCVRILRRHAEMLNLEPSFTILDTDDQVRLIKELLKAEEIDDKKNPARQYAAAIGRFKDRGIPCDALTQAEVRTHYLPKISLIYTLYQGRLRTLNAVDFGDLILHTLTLFRNFPEILESYQRQFKFILVDEYQDTNVAQYLWLRLLAQKTHSICCVGDDDQSIYGWRGAEVGNILRFEQDFSGAKLIRLEQNYRSTPHILAAASHLISHNRGRLGKTLWTEEGEGEKVRVQGLWDGQEEARWVGDEIEVMHLKGESLSKVAILVRAGFQTRAFEERFLTLGVPYRVVGGARFYERQEIRDAIAYLRVVVHPKDSLAFERILNVPRRGMGPAALNTLHTLAREQGVSLVDASRIALHKGMIKGAARQGLADFIASLDRWRALTEKEEPAALTRRILEESGYTAMWQQDKTPEAPGRLENLKELVQAIQEFPNLLGFLEHISLVMENAKQTHLDQVNLMTLHSAKGLEFETVFLCGWEEGVFPHSRVLNEQGDEGVEEERRLAYVGITRARKKAIITHAANRQIYNQWQSSAPSRFLDELPFDHIDANKVRGGQASPRHQPHAYLSPRRSQNRFSTGDRVKHSTFGTGTVIEIDGDGVEVFFDKGGEKCIVADYLEASKDA